MTLFDLIPPVPEHWKRPPYVIIDDEGKVKKNEVVKAVKVLTPEERDHARQKAEDYNAKRRAMTAVRLANEAKLKQETEGMVYTATLERGVWGES